MQWKPASAHGSSHLSVLVQQSSGQWEALIILKPYSSIKRSTRLHLIGPELLATSLSVSAALLYLSSCFYLKNNISRCIESAHVLPLMWFRCGSCVVHESDKAKPWNARMPTNFLIPNCSCDVVSFISGSTNNWTSIAHLLSLKFTPRPKGRDIDS